MKFSRNELSLGAHFVETLGRQNENRIVPFRTKEFFVFTLGTNSRDEIRILHEEDRGAMCADFVGGL
jgi:hypothetical protein